MEFLESMYTVTGKFCKPLPDRRVSASLVSKGSIYAAVQQQDPASSVLRVVNGNRPTPTDVTVQPSTSSSTMLNHRATPNSDDASDHDAASNAGFDVGSQVTIRVQSGCLVSITLHYASALAQYLLSSLGWSLFFNF